MGSELSTLATFEAVWVSDLPAGCLAAVLQAGTFSHRNAATHISHLLLALLHSTSTGGVLAPVLDQQTRHMGTHVIADSSLFSFITARAA
jgi:hypothetical protein